MDFFLPAAAVAKSLQSCLTLHDPRTAAYQAPPTMGLSRQGHWSGVPLPSPFLSLVTKKINIGIYFLFKSYIRNFMKWR